MKKNIEQIEQLYSFKTVAVEHLSNRRYSQASVYFKDIVDKFQTTVKGITDQEEMERAIRQLKLSSHKNLSLCYLKLDQYQKCVDQCKVILQIQPNNIKILYRIGRAYISINNLQTAQHYLKKGFHLDPHEKEIMKALQEIQLINTTKDAEKEEIQQRWTILQLIKHLIALFFIIPMFFIKKLKGRTPQNKPIGLKQ